jgi:hypothetical protein
MPVVTIETKQPSYEATFKEIVTFKTRLVHYGTLRYAYLTNGQTWVRQTLLAPSGRQEITETKTVDIKTTRKKELNEFLEGLNSNHYIATE